jgi:hypothetical protein
VRSHAKAPSAGSTKGATVRFGALFVLATTFFLVAVGAAAAAPPAVPAYGYLASFGEAELSGGNAEAPGAIAVEPGTGNIIVADGESVDVFAPDASLGGVPLTSIPIGGSAGSIAIDQGNGAVYIAGSELFARYLSDGAATPTYTLDPSFSPAVTGDQVGGLAVNPTTHDLLLTGSAGVTRLSPSGTFISSFDGSTSPTGPLSGPRGIAVASNGDIYVVDYQRVQRFDSSGAWLGSLPIEGDPTNVAVDQASGRAVVTVGGFSEPASLMGFTPGGERLYRVPAKGTYMRGLAIDSDHGRAYQLAYDYGSTLGVHAFVSATLPGVEAPVVSGATTTSIHVSAEVDPGAGPPPGSAVRFEYMPAGGSSWEATPDQPYTGSPMETDVTGLSPNVDYLVRAVASNSLIDNASKATPFTTLGVPPGTVTGDATDVTETSAVLNGTINPVGLQSGYHFEYGLTTAYGSRIPQGIEAVAGNGRSPRIFSRTIEGLQPGTTYHYRLVASNSAGVAEGADRTFTTIAAGAIARRGYEQVTPIDKLGGVIDSRSGFQAKADGSGMSYISRPASGGLESAPLMARSMSLRTGTAWNSGIGLDPPIGVQPVGGVFTYLTTLAVSADFKHSFVVTDQKLTPDAVAGGTNLYVRDLGSGAYSLVTTAGHEALPGFISLGSNNKFIAGSPDFSWVVFGSGAPLLPGVAGTAVYRWSQTDGLSLESTLPNGSPPAASALLFGNTGGVRSVSDDGSRDYFTLKEEGAEDGVYLREDGQVRAISVSHIPGDPATVQAAQFLGTGKDGRYAFFASKGAPLTSDAPGSLGDVYRFDADDDELEYVGAQAGGGFLVESSIFGVSDDGGTAYFETPDHVIKVWRNGALRDVGTSIFGIARGFGFLSPSGRYFAFSFEPPGTAPAVYLYDADAEELSCASCLSDGTPSFGTLPSSERFVGNSTPQAVDDSGQLFFDSPARLVAADANGESDVYVFQDGKASLISPGNAPFEARFADMSEDGSDVFFTTNQKLVGQDNDDSPDIYDARIGGGLASQNPPPPQECLRDDCKATPNAGPELPFGGSEALSGPGNVKAEARKRCGKGSHTRKVKGKSRCVKQSKNKNAKKAKSNRRQAR